MLKFHEFPPREPEHVELTANLENCAHAPATYAHYEFMGKLVGSSLIANTEGISAGGIYDMAQSLLGEYISDNNRLSFMRGVSDEINNLIPQERGSDV